MKIQFNPNLDTLVIYLSESPSVETNEVRPGFIVDLDREGRVVKIEILKASSQVDDPYWVEIEEGDPEPE